MNRLTREDLLAVLDSFLAGRVGFERVRRFVFQYYEAEEDIEIEDDLELVFAALGPYLEYEEAYSDGERRERMQRLRDQLSAKGNPAERTVWALEFQRIRELQRRLETGGITRAVYDAQLGKLSPAAFDVRTVARWAAAHRQFDELGAAREDP